MSINKGSIYYQSNYQHCFVFFFALSMIGVIYSRFLLSLSYGLFGGLMLYSIISTKELKVKIKSRGLFWFLSITLLWWIFAFSGLWSANTGYWLDKLRLKLPFLLFPLFAFFMRKIDRRSWHQILLAFILITTISTMEVLFNIFKEKDQIHELLFSGGAFKTPINHIRYSMLLCLASIFSFIMVLESYLSSKRWRNLLLVIFLYLTLLLHVLAVRTGLIGFYLMFGTYIVYYSIRQRSYRYLVLLAYMGILPILALKLPSVQAKMDYYKESIFFMKEGHNGNLYSDSDRVLSMKIALDATKESPWIGLGAGDMYDKMKEGYQDYPDRNRILMPHNQFIAYHMAAGILGLLVMIAALAFCFWGCRLYQDSILFIHYLYLLFAASFETTFDISIGVALFIYPLFAGVVYHFGIEDQAISDVK